MTKRTGQAKGKVRRGPDGKRHMSLHTRMMWNKYLPIWLMMIPVFAFFFVFKVLPMYGIQMAFKDFNLMKGIADSPWVGLKHFKRLFNDPYFYRIFKNTIKISLLSLCACIPAEITLALLINELRSSIYKRIVQTISYLPHFISWVIAGGIFTLLLSTQNGAINKIIEFFGGKAIFFLGDADYFVGTLIVTRVWKSVGWGTIIYLAAIAGINQELYESAMIDGANRFQRIWYITLPALVPTIVMLTIMALAGVLSAGFDQIYNLYNQAVYSVADVIDTYVYRQGFENASFSYSTAVGLFNSVVSFILVITANWLSKRFVKYSMW